MTFISGNEPRCQPQNVRFEINTFEVGPAFSYKLRYIVGFRFVEMAISTNPKPTIYRNLYEKTYPAVYGDCKLNKANEENIE